MNKEYLETLGKNIRYKKEYIGAGLYRLYIKRNDIELLEQSLQRLESIDNANPSEALEELGKYELKQDCLVEDLTVYDTIKQALLKAQENEKVLSIIKEKDVDIKFLRALINSDSKYTRKNALKIYNLCLDNEQLTEEEFDLLKRWLG